MHLGAETIQNALKRVGEVLAMHRTVEVLVVGGAAGVLTGELPPAWTTADVDVLHFHLPQDRDAVLDASEQVARELSLPPSWMSEDVGLHRWTLPPDWRDRRVLVCSSGPLRVYAAGRLDLLTMKFVAHRGIDIEHLSRMSVRREELDFIRRQLDRLAREYGAANEAAQIERALQLVDSWSSS